LNGLNGEIEDMKHNTTCFVPILMLLVLTILCIPSICPAQSHVLAGLYWKQAKALQEQGKYLEAARMSEKAAATEQAYSDPKLANVAVAFNNAGYNYSMVGQYDKAIEHFQHALKIDRQLGNEALLAVRLNNIGQIYYSRGQYDKAIEHYQQALEIDRRLGKEGLLAVLLNNIGQVYYS
jgi:tetratricopeptide (TPR) repeat protein